MSLGGYNQIPYMYDDLIRNLEEESEVEKVVDEYNRGLQDTKLLSSDEEEFGDGRPSSTIDQISRLRTQDYKYVPREPDVEESVDTNTR